LNGSSIFSKHTVFKFHRANQPAPFNPPKQRELERYICFCIDKYVIAGNTRNVVLSGGVAYNCVAVGRLVRSYPELNFFVQPASGDVGQCVGNAVFGCFALEGTIPNIGRRAADLGGRYKVSGRIKRRLQNLSDHYALDRSCMLFAKALVDGRIGGCFSGRSEYGPRALGHRSIVGLASQKALRVRLNALKKRNFLMPVAPVISFDDLSKYFDTAVASPFMAQTVPLRQEYKETLAAIDQMRGGARLQVVSRGDRSPFYKLLRQLRGLGQLPIIGNTSLNGPGEPIAESIGDFIRFCNEAEVEFAWINGTFYDLRNDRLPKTLQLSSSTYEESVVNEFSSDKLSERLSAIFPHLSLLKRDRFLLRGKYLDWVRDGRKTTTVRFTPDGVEYPASQLLPVYATQKFERITKTGEPDSFFKVTGVHYKRFVDLDEKDAQRDGFRNVHQLKATLCEIYPNVSDIDVVTIYTVVCFT